MAAPTVLHGAKHFSIIYTFNSHSTFTKCDYFTYEELHLRNIILG